MHKFRFGLATLAVVGVVGGALADSSGHASMNSLKWQMRQMQRTEHYSGLIGNSYSSWRGCAVEQIGVMHGCSSNHRRQ